MRKLKNKDIAWISLFAALMAIGAYVRIPAPIVDITLQIFFATLCPLLLGRKKAVITQVIYIWMGIIGLPVFSGGGGIGYMLKPSFGYIIGFVVCAHVSGYIIEHSKKMNFKNCFLASLGGVFSCYSFGVAYLYVILRFVTKVEIGNILVSGFLIFLPWDLIKITIVSISAPKIYKALYHNQK